MSDYVNLNKCRSFNQAISSSLIPLADQICSEVVIVNRTTQPILVFDGGYSDAQNGFLLGSSMKAQLLEVSLIVIKLVLYQQQEALVIFTIERNTTACHLLGNERYTHIR